MLKLPVIELVPWALAGALTPIAGAQGQATFQGLGDPPGGLVLSEATAVSADGQVVVGVSVVAGDTAQAFRWTEASGMVGLGDLPGRASAILMRAMLWM
jgi:probable HAF family extracellular repeat protein